MEFDDLDREQKHLVSVGATLFIAVVLLIVPFVAACALLFCAYLLGIAREGCGETQLCAILNYARIGLIVFAAGFFLAAQIKAVSFVYSRVKELRNKYKSK